MFNLLKLLSSSLIAFLIASHAYAESFIEVIVVGKAWPEHKWGHVSLRIKNDSRDLVYDFGRYGAMWGFFDTEGEPILRVWKSDRAHLNSQREGNPEIHVARFQATERETEEGFKYFDELIQNAEIRHKSTSFDSYKLNTTSFHAVNNNCVTTAIAGFSAAVPYLDINMPQYAKGDDLYSWARSKANNIEYDKKNKQWNHIWWPQDLLNLIKEEYGNRGLVTIETL